MAKLIKKIRTEDGDLQIDYKALANLPKSDTTLTKSDAFADAKAVGDAVNDKLSLSGGTLTGDLTISDSYPYLRLATPNGNDISALYGSVKEHKTYLCAFSQGTAYYEGYGLPKADSDLTEHKWYRLLTSKEAVKISEGGTGATTAADARTALGITPANIGALPSSGGTITGELAVSKFKLSGSSVQSYDLTMGSVASGKVLSTKGAINLAHSHAVIVNDDGTITLGEVSATGGNFKIADTKAYKDGVSAAKNSVTLSKSWSSGTVTVKASNGKTSTATLSKGSESWSGNTCSFPIMDGTSSTGYTCSVDATTRYNAGRNSVTVPNANIVRNADDKYNSSDHSTTVTIKATASNGKYGTQTFTVSGKSAYDAGYSAGSAGGSDNGGWTLAYNKVSMPSQGTGESFSINTPAVTFGLADMNTFQLLVDSPSASGGYAKVQRVGTGIVAQKSLADWWNAGVSSVTAFNPEVVSSEHAHATSQLIAVTLRSKASNGATKDFDTSINAAPVYDYGYSVGESAGKSAVTVSSISTGTAGAPTGSGPFYSSVSVTATASNGATKTESKSVNVTQVYSNGYNAGYEAGFAAAESQYTAGTYYKGNGATVYARGTAVTPTKRTLYVAPTGGATAVTVYDVGSSSTLYQGNGAVYVSRGDKITAYIKTE